MYFVYEENQKPIHEIRSETFQYLEYNAISLGYQCITNDIAILFENTQQGKWSTESLL